MNIADTYYNLRRRVVGDIHGEGKSPWYTRWFWWVIIIGVALVVFAVWFFAKKREARYRALARTSEMEAEKARLKAEGARDEAEANELQKKAEIAEKRAEYAEQKISETAEKRKKLEASIKGAKSWEELEKIESRLP